VNKNTELEIINKITQETKQEMATTFPELTTEQKEIINTTTIVSARILTKYVDEHLFKSIDWYVREYLKNNAESFREYLKEI